MHELLDTNSNSWLANVYPPSVVTARF